MEVTSVNPAHLGDNRKLPKARKEQLERDQLIEALSELYSLLERYAPAWYTRAHHEKAQAALRQQHKE